jgi:hypothetical protein
MTIPAGVIFIWAGTNASIPSGWERVTSLDSKYPKATASETNPNQTGGSADHSHAGTTHSHTMNSHTHSVSLGTCTTSGENAGNNAIVAHGHNAVTSSGSSGGALSSVSCTYASLANDPPYYTVIFITPSEGQRKLPDQAIYLYDGTDSKSGHYACSGSNSTPNLVDRYLLGAGTGANAGTTGGSRTNVHTLTHTHSVAGHTHGTFNSAVPNTTSKADWWGGTTGGVSNTGHQHSLTPNSTTASLTGTVTLTTSETVEPAYKKLLAIQNRTGEADIRRGIIGMWLGTLADIPDNYALCDGSGGTVDMRGKHLKITATTGDVGNTGGSNTHTHASQNHTHTGVSHTHTHGTINHSAFYDGGGGPQTAEDKQITTTGSTHPFSCSNVTATYANAATSGASANNEPPYRTVAFIKLLNVGLGGSFILNMV